MDNYPLEAAAYRLAKVDGKRLTGRAAELAKAAAEYDKAIARENLRINRQMFGWHGINWAPELASHLFRALFKSDDDAKAAKPRAKFDYLDRERDDDSTCDGECPCCAGCSDCGSCY